MGAEELSIPKVSPAWVRVANGGSSSDGGGGGGGDGAAADVTGGSSGGELRNHEIDADEDDVRLPATVDQFYFIRSKQDLQAKLVTSHYDADTYDDFDLFSDVLASDY